MEAKAIQRYVRITPRKCNQVLDLIRGLDVESAQTTLQFTPKYGARAVQKVLKSAVAKALETGGPSRVDEPSGGRAPGGGGLKGQSGPWPAAGRAPPLAKAIS